MATKKSDNCGLDFPGPGQYTLPPLLGCKGHDITHWRYPCYSFGIKLREVGAKAPGPGPFEYTIDNVTRFGRDTSLKAPITGRHVDKAYQQLPGPGAYSPEMYLNSVLTKAPVFSFGRKLKSVPPPATPGPNAYNVTNVTAKRPPSFSILGKRPDQKRPDMPGPAAYGVPNINLTKKSTPAFSMGARREGKRPALLPGPGAYAPNDSYILPRAPRFTLTGRPNPCVKPYILPTDDV